MSEFASKRAEAEHCLRMLGSGRVNYAARLAELLVPDEPSVSLAVELQELPVIDPGMLPAADLQSEPAAVSGEATVIKAKKAKRST